MTRAKAAVPHHASYGYRFKKERRELAFFFQEITSIPDAKSLVDVVLSQTQRRTPTVVHPQFKISRIRSFYMRKVKFCQQTYHDKLSLILTEFPRLDDIHPFYADLCNVLYDRDHFKLALGQVNTVRSVVDRAAKDYVRLLKYADSPYKCKMLKRAALGRMCTAVKKLGDSLKYLEEVRQHLSRLPCINPTTRCLILTGFPNVGKSSFMNSVTNANVEVQPYAFTTKSLYVGHFDWAYARWQVIDTPGILDHPLANRNTIELTAITALAHLPAAILYFVDISEQCGFSLEAQVSLFHSIKVLFKGRPLVIVLNKVDVVRAADLDEARQALLRTMTTTTTTTTTTESRDSTTRDSTTRDNTTNNQENGANHFCGDHQEEAAAASGDVVVVEVSCLTATGVDEAKNKACEMLLARRVEAKIVSKRTDTIDHRLHATSVSPAPDRPPSIPPRVARQRMLQQQQVAANNPRDYHEQPVVALKLAREVELENGGPGVYSVDLNAGWSLANSDWKYDVMPEIYDGKNVLDFIDPEIEAKLKELEREEAGLLAAAEEEGGLTIDEEAEWKGVSRMLVELHQKRKRKRLQNMMKKNLSHTIMPRRSGSLTTSEIGERLTAAGYRLGSKGIQAKAQKKREPGSCLENRLQTIIKSPDPQTADSETDSCCMMSDDRSDHHSEDDDDDDDDVHRFSGHVRNRRLPVADDDSSSIRNRQGHTNMPVKSTRSETARKAAKKRLQLLGAARLKSNVGSSKRVSEAIRDAKLRRPNRLKSGLNYSEAAFRRAENVKRKKGLARAGCKGEADRFIGTKKPLHLFSGKRGIGKADRR